MPLLEVIFRLFLANGNQPLTPEELLQGLRKRRGEVPVALTPEALCQLLEKDSYYGIRPEETED
jgi:hypothetical protein